MDNTLVCVLDITPYNFSAEATLTRGLAIQQSKYKKSCQGKVVHNGR